MRIEEVVPKILANKLGSPLANEKAARDAVGKLTAPILKRVDQASTFARGAIVKVTQQTSSKPPSDATEAIYHLEVRSVLARIPAAERSKATKQAIDSGDDAFVAGAVTGSPILTGLAPAEQQMSLETWRSRRHPERPSTVAVQAELAQLQAKAEAAPSAEIKSAIEQGQEAAKHLDEADTPRLIDAQLRARGWVADSEKLTYSAGVRPVKGQSLAIAEWSTTTAPVLLRAIKSRLQWWI
jgi:hypothetical protein